MPEDEEKPIENFEVFEKEMNAVSYDKVYKPLMFPWTTELDDDVKRTGKTFSKY